MPMTKDPVRIIAYDAIFPQWAAFEAGLDTASGGGQRRFNVLHRQYQRRIDQTKESNPQLVDAVSQALPELLRNLERSEPRVPRTPAGRSTPSGPAVEGAPVAGLEAGGMRPPGTSSVPQTPAPAAAHR